MPSLTEILQAKRARGCGLVSLPVHDPVKLTLQGDPVSAYQQQTGRRASVGDLVSVAPVHPLVFSTEQADALAQDVQVSRVLGFPFDIVGLSFMGVGRGAPDDARFTSCIRLTTESALDVLTFALQDKLFARYTEDDVFVVGDGSLFLPLRVRVVDVPTRIAVSHRGMDASTLMCSTVVLITPVAAITPDEEPLPGEQVGGIEVVDQTPFISPVDYALSRCQVYLPQNGPETELVGPDGFTVHVQCSRQVVEGLLARGYTVPGYPGEQ